MKKEFIQSDLRNILIAACLLLGLVIFGYFLINNYPGTNEKKKLRDVTSTSESITSLTNSNAKKRVTKTFNITAKVASVDLGNGKKVDAWTFDGTSPGTQIRVKQGERIVVNLKNELPEPVTIHWHGLDVPAAVDGVPGVTQNAIKPGETYTYAFNADQVGTYWYHSHQKSAIQTERGLFGTIVIEPNKPAVKYEKDYTVAIHEWKTGAIKTRKHNGEQDKDWDSYPSNHIRNEKAQTLEGPLMMPSNDQLKDLSDGDDYDVFTLNDTSEGLRLDAKPGETVRLRLINAGNNTHLMTLVGAPFQIIALDGRDIKGGDELDKAILPMGAAQRYDLVFKMPETTSVKLINVDPSKKMNRMLTTTIGNGSLPKKPVDIKSYPWFDFTKYGEKEVGKFTIDSKFTKVYDMDLAEGVKDVNGQEKWVYTINGKTSPDIPPIKVEKGDKVKIRFKNKGEEIHPMHLHGHTFQVISKNGKPMEGSPIYLDTVNVFPGEEYEIALEANNSGLWMVHCHHLVHAEKGMHTMMNYEGVTTPFSTGDHAGNHPE
ncbi:multicopper oxidase family protein [Bacillus mycoides]|uniref:Uncharacterized protein n=1 Tax=Bacillus mycoides TaxID=1405 RepID=A0A2B4XU07_BACMY|nr:multicopper oxidase family protein [Bacillus mycoides]EJQ72782.1 hypothetical protein IG7_01627 [Bacillus cereus HuA2-4]MED1383307.1 multicopper oxidase family protein [Bacillus mycoides]PFX93077.1 copper oxidase [Bacillus mycoides]QWH77834.1 multicopper oxidase family protein [Bacillus mycoides]QWI42884.1 multicopper oxidase family protein [Bacillus mycoides]